MIINTSILYMSPTVVLFKTKTAYNNYCKISIHLLIFSELEGEIPTPNDCKITLKCKKII